MALSDKENKQIEENVEAVRRKQRVEDSQHERYERMDKYSTEPIKKTKPKPARKESQPKEKAAVAAKTVAKWAVGKTYSKTMGTYKPRISEGDVGNEYGGGGYNYNPYSGFGSLDYGKSFSGGFNGSFEQSPFSSGLRSRKRNMSWKPPRF